MSEKNKLTRAFVKTYLDKCKATPGIWVNFIDGTGLMYEAEYRTYTWKVPSSYFNESGDFDSYYQGGATHVTDLILQYSAELGRYEIKASSLLAIDNRPS